jgi:protoporphyrinogen oxidase
MPPTIAILGAGPAGLALALKLLQRPDPPRVVMVEREPQVGGLAASFWCKGIPFDYGSHRLHETVRADILADLQALLGEDLLYRERRGRILMEGRFVRYPLDPQDLLKNLPLGFMLRFGRDLLTSPLRRTRPDAASYAEVLRSSLGPTLAEAFYFPFAQKLWGLPPDELAAEQARRRVSASSPGKLLRRVASALPGVEAPAAGHHYYYPRGGFGQISTAMAERVRELGGEIQLSTEAIRVDVKKGRVIVLWLAPREGAEATVEGGSIRPDFVFSTIPIPSLASTLYPPPSANVRQSAERLRYRAVRFCYLILGVDRFTPYDAHYFPQTDLCFSRVSESKNYTGADEPQGRTGLCAEMPFFPGDKADSASAEELAEMVLRDLARAGLDIGDAPVERVLAKRYDHAYPVYDLSFAENLAAVRDHIAAIDNLVTLGRQGDFAHDNLHHALEVAYAAAECLGEDALHWDEARWQEHRRAFAEHVVVD